MTKLAFQSESTVLAPGCGINQVQMALVNVIAGSQVWQAGIGREYRGRYPSHMREL